MSALDAIYGEDAGLAAIKKSAAAAAPLLSAQIGLRTAAIVEDVFSAPSHVLPPPNRLCGAFLERLLAQQRAQALGALDEARRMEQVTPETIPTVLFSDRFALLVSWC